MRREKAFLTIALLALWAAAPVRAASNQTQLKADNIDTQHSLKFTIKAEKKSDGVHFLVTIEPKAAELSSILESNLAIMDGGNQIASVPVELRRTEKAVTCEFVVAEKYLEFSTYNFGNMAVSNGVPMPAGDFYWFHLKDVANLK